MDIIGAHILQNDNIPSRDTLKGEKRQAWCRLIPWILLIIITSPLIIIFFPIIVPILWCMVRPYRAKGIIPWRIAFSGCVTNLLLNMWRNPLNVSFPQDIRIILAEDPHDAEKVVLSIQEDNKKHDCLVYVWQKETVSIKQAKKIVFLLYGGGFVMGHASYLAPLARKLTKQLGDDWIVVAPNYKLASHTYKVNDIVMSQLYVLKWFLQTYMDGDVEKIILMGDSAGAKLALLMVQAMRDNKNSNLINIDKNLIKVVAICPTIFTEHTQRDRDMNRRSLKSWREFWKYGCFVNQSITDFFEINSEYGTGRYNNYDLLENTKNLPSTFIIVAKYDYLRDEGKFYAELTLNTKLQEFNEVHTIMNSNYNLLGASGIDNLLTYVFDFIEND